MKAGLSRRRFNALAACALAAAAWPLAAQESAAFAVIEFDWHDAARSRAVPLSLYWPLNVFGQGDAGALASWAARHRAILARFVEPTPALALA